MNRISAIALAALCPVALALGGCGSVPTENAIKIMTAFGDTYRHCHHGVTYSATIGGMNPASGINVQGQIDCPAVPAVPPVSNTTAPGGG